MWHNNDISIEHLIGKTVTAISGALAGSDEVIFNLSDGTGVRMFHQQDCCEHVEIESVNGDTEDLIGSSILKATKYTNEENPQSEHTDSHLWTFYTIATAKGEVDIRWYGESNGYYSESVDLELIPVKH